ncbi:MAG: serine--tRNA ligase [Bryobacter sp.]
MHDFQLFRGQLDQVAERLATRGFVLDKSAFRELDQKRRDALTEVERLKAERNERSKDIGARKKAGEDTAELQAAVRLVGDRIAELEGAATKFDEEFRDLLKGIPNLPHESVPVGKDEHDNVELRREGTPREMGFAPKAHWDLGVDLGILDFERAAKVTGARFAFYVGLGAKLERALINFMLDLHTNEHGYTETLPPFLVNSESLYGTGQLPKFAEDLFHCEGTDLWLAPTAEVPVTNFLRDETVAEEKLPVKLCAYTPCFRSEAGSHGRDVRGIIRQHQFQKVELVKFAAPETSMAELDALTNDAENVLRKLGLPFRTVVLCTGDMGFSSARTHDIEVWLPGQQTYKEISSCSNFEGFQARRAGIRYKAGKKSEYLHTLNGSGLAVGRTWVAIVENYQEADGSVVVPEALRPYLNAERITAGASLV